MSQCAPDAEGAANGGRAAFVHEQTGLAKTPFVHEQTGLTKTPHLFMCGARAGKMQEWSMAEQTADAYDFADFGFGDALDDALAGLDEADQIGAILKLKAEQVDREVRRLLQTAFATFKEAGRWYWQVAREGCSPQGVRLDWVPKRGSAYWVDEFPVRIAISPSDWLASLVAELLPSDEQWYDQEELAAALAEWRAALDEAETRLRQHFGK